MSARTLIAAFGRSGIGAMERKRMERSDDEVSNLERALRWLLYDLCVKGGFCISSDTTDAIARRSSWTAEEFARAVLEAEGMNPDYEKKSLRGVKEWFVERFGEIVTANDFEIDE